MLTVQISTLHCSSSEARLKIPDITISVHGSSCHYIFFWSHSCFLAFSFYTYWHPQRWMGCQDINRERKEEKMRQKREMHELPYTKIVKTWTILLTYDIKYISWYIWLCGIVAAQHVECHVRF